MTDLEAGFKTQNFEPDNDHELTIYPLPSDKFSFLTPEGAVSAEIYETNDPNIFLRKTTNPNTNNSEMVLIRLSLEQARAYRRQLVKKPGRTEFLEETITLYFDNKGFHKTSE